MSINNTEKTATLNYTSGARLTGYQECLTNLSTNGNKWFLQLNVYRYTEVPVFIVAQVHDSDYWSQVRKHREGL